MGVVVNLNGDRGGKPSLKALTSLVAEDMAAGQRPDSQAYGKLGAVDSAIGRTPDFGGRQTVTPDLDPGRGTVVRLCRKTATCPLAACVEFLHTATLLHDDVVDHSALRRGLASANAVWGNKTSVLVGDFLLARAFNLMVEDGSLEVLAILSRTSSIMAEGEVLQISTTNDTETSEAAYLDVIRAKTAALFAAACRVGAVIAERPRIEQEALDSYGMNLGVAFQLVDDMLDYAADQKTLGKTVGDDFTEGKVTLPAVLAYRRGDDEQRSFWRRTLGEMEQKEGDLEHAMALMNEHNALSDTIERARHYGAMARDALAIFPDRAEKKAMLGLVDFAVERAF